MRMRSKIDRQELGQQRMPAIGGSQGTIASTRCNSSLGEKKTFDAFSLLPRNERFFAEMQHGVVRQTARGVA